MILKSIFVFEFSSTECTILRFILHMHVFYVFFQVMLKMTEYYSALYMHCNLPSQQTLCYKSDTCGQFHPPAWPSNYRYLKKEGKCLQIYFMFIYLILSIIYLQRVFSQPNLTSNGGGSEREVGWSPPGGRITICVFKQYHTRSHFSLEEWKPLLQLCKRSMGGMEVVD